MEEKFLNREYPSFNELGKLWLLYSHKMTKRDQGRIKLFQAFWKDSLTMDEKEFKKLTKETNKFIERVMKKLKKEGNV